VNPELERLKNEYAARDRTLYSKGWQNDIYHPRHPIGRLQYLHRFEILIDALNAAGDFPLEAAKVLDYGCGAGGWLRMLVELGANPEHLTGLDMSESRIQTARRANPGIHWRLIAGDAIPEPDASFDLTLQSTVFSSILDEQLARRLAREMVRVTRPGGLILWSDLLIGSPGRLTAYPLERVRALFSDCEIVYQRRAFPAYFQRLYMHPWLCKLLPLLGERDCEYLIAILRAPAITASR
jgi:SAM-dependent methyltransferase